MKLYHGTSKKRLPDIEKNGLTANQYKAGWSGVYLTNTPQIARDYAEIRADNDEEGGRGVVCEVEADESNLSADMEMYSYPHDSVLEGYGCNQDSSGAKERCWNRLKKRGKVPKIDENDWRLSLEVLGSVISMKPIPAKFVRCRIK